MIFQHLTSSKSPFSQFSKSAIQCHFLAALQFYLRSETLGSGGISTPPRSIIEIDGIDYSKHIDGFNLAVIDITTGIVESSVNFRIDSDPSSEKPFIDYLAQIPGKIVHTYLHWRTSVKCFFYLILSKLLAKRQS